MNPNTIITLPKRLLECALKDTNKDDRKPILGAFVDGTARRIVVTNGSALAIIPIPGDQDASTGLITPDLWKMARAKNAKGYFLDWSEGTLNGLPLESQHPQFPYPNIDNIIPTYEAAYRITINPDFISDLAASLGHDGKVGFTMEFPNFRNSSKSDVPPIRIQMGDKSAILMPMRGRDDDGLLAAPAAGKKERERSHTPAAEADVKVIDDLRAALFQERALVAELKAKLEAPANVNPVDTPPSPPATPPASGRKAKREVPYATEPPVLSRNEPRNGIELRFNGKPDDATRQELTARGWKWSPVQPGQPWYVRYSEENWLYANHLSNGSDYTAMPEDAASDAGETPAPEPQATAAPTPPSSGGRLRKIEIPDI